MISHDEPIPKNRWKKHADKHKSYKDTAAPEEKEHTYGIDRLNIGNPSVESEN